MAPKQKYNTRLKAAAERAAAVQEKKEQNAFKKKVGKEDSKNTVPQPTTSFMDPKLWGNLQHHIDLLELVYCRLSLEAFFELRAVCKAWYAVARQRMALQSSIPKPFFPLYTRGGRFYRLDGILTYNKSAKAKPPAAEATSWDEWSPNPCTPSCTSPPGFGRDGATPKIWFLRLINSLPTKVWFVVIDLGINLDWPCMSMIGTWPRTRITFRGPSVATIGAGMWLKSLTMDECKRSSECLYASPNCRVGFTPFKLVLGCLELDTLVYDSERQSWESQPCRPKVRGDLLHPTTGCAACNGRVYITLEFSREILVYDFESASWSSIDAPAAGGAVTSMQPQHYCNDTLGAWNGRILDVVDDAESSDSLSLWALVDEEWRVFDRMPEDLYKLWLRGLDAPADQAGLGARLTIHASFCGDYVLVYSWVFKYEQARRFCLYNMATKVWQKLEVDARTVFIKRRHGSDDWDGWDE